MRWKSVLGLVAVLPFGAGCNLAYYAGHNLVNEPVTRAEIEGIRGVAVSAGTLDVLMAAGWVRPAGRRETPGRPLQYASTPGFLADFGLASRRDLPGLADLRAAGLLDADLPAQPELSLLTWEAGRDARDGAGEDGHAGVAIVV